MTFIKNKKKNNLSATRLKRCLKAGNQNYLSTNENDYSENDLQALPALPVKCYALNSYAPHSFVAHSPPNITRRIPRITTKITVKLLKLIIVVVFIFLKVSKIFLTDSKKTVISGHVLFLDFKKFIEDFDYKATLEIKQRTFYNTVEITFELFNCRAVKETSRTGVCFSLIERGSFKFINKKENVFFIDENKAMPILMEYLEVKEKKAETTQIIIEKLNKILTKYTMPDRCLVLNDKQVKNRFYGEISELLNY